MASFFSPLQAECIERHDFQPPTEARPGVFESLEVLSTWQRLHSSLG